MPRIAARTDKNHTEIVKALRDFGCSVHSLAAVHGGCPDLLVGVPGPVAGANLILEVKDGAKPPSARKLTPLQEKFRDGWKGQWAVVESPEEAIELIINYRF